MNISTWEEQQQKKRQIEVWSLTDTLVWLKNYLPLSRFSPVKCDPDGEPALSIPVWFPGAELTAVVCCQAPEMEPV